MDMVFAKHTRNSLKEYCFEVPVEVKKQLKKDMMIFVETKFGKEIAYTTTRVISGSGAIDVALKNGATYPLKRVISFVPVECNQKLFDIFKEEVVQKIYKSVSDFTRELESLSCLEDDLPF